MTDQEAVPLEINAELKVEVELSTLCFICNKNVDDHGCRDSERRDEYKPSFQEGDKGQYWSSVKILTAHIINSPSSCPKDRERIKEIQSEILSSFKKGQCSICAGCLSRAGNLLELHLELEKIQMQILDVLKNLQDYLKSEVVRRDGDCDDLHSRFQDVLQREFICRELSTTSLVHLEGVRAAGACHDNASSVVYICPEPEVESPRDISTPVNDKFKSKRAVLTGCPTSDLEQVISGDLDVDFSPGPEDLGDQKEDIKPVIDVDTTASLFYDIDMDIVPEPQIQISVDPGNKYKRRHRSTRKRARNPIPEETFQSDNDFNDDDDIDNADGDHSDSRDGDGDSHGGTDQISQNTKLPKRRKPVSLWECDICLDRIPSKEIKLHFQRHPEFEKLYECDICPRPKIRLRRKKIYGTYKGLVWHYIRARHKVQLACQLCPDKDQSESRLYRRAELCRHLYEFHQLNHKKLPCKKEGCPEEFYDPLTRESHFYLEHSKINPCGLCEMKFGSKTDLKDHYRNCHGGTNRKLLSCSSCPKQFKNQASLRSHAKAEHGESDLVMCPQCSKMLPRSGLNRHIKQVHKKEEGNFVCEHCSKTFVYKYDLNFHQQTHRTERTYKCPVEGCSYAARYEKALKNHRKIHDEKRIQCQFCPKVFRFMSHLKSHESTHKKPEEREEEKVYSCQYCPKTFSMRRNLKDHEDAHRNERNSFQCPEPGCWYKGSNRNSLNNHKSKWHKEKTLKCQFCPKMFAVKSLLKIHEITHSKEKSFKCDVCEEAFRSRDGRYRHRKKLHPDVVVVKRSLAGVGIVNQEEKDQ